MQHHKALLLAEYSLPLGLLTGAKLEEEAAWRIL